MSCCQERSIVVVDGIHLDEWPVGIISFLLALRAYKSAKIWAELGNPAGYAQPVDPLTGRRARTLNGENIGMCAPGSPHGTPARRRAYELLQIYKQATLGVGMHGVEHPRGECAWYGPRQTNLARSVAATLFKRAIVAPPYHLAFYRPNVFDAELSEQTGPTPAEVCNLLIEVSEGYTPPTQQIEEYEYVRHIEHDGIPAELGHRLGLKRRYMPFEPLSAADAQRLQDIGYPEQVLYANAWDADIYEGRNGYWGEVLVRCSTE